MKRKIFGALFVISLVLIISIIGGTQNGEPLSSMWWCVPLFIVLWVSGKISQIFEV